MLRTTLLAAAIFSVTVAAQAADVQASASASASVSNPFDLKAAKDAAAKTAAGSRDAAINGGIGAMASGKSSAEAAKAAAADAKTAGMASMEQAKADTAARMGTTQAMVVGYKQKATDTISPKDQLALGKHFAASKATGMAIGKLFGTSSNSDLPKDYSKKLVIGAKLDAAFAGKTTPIDATTVKGLSAQPAGTVLVKVGDRTVRLDAKTQVVLDVASM